MNVLNADPQKVRSNLSIFRIYFFEISVVVLGIVTGYLFYGQKELQKDMRNYLLNDRERLIIKLDENTSAIKDNTQVIQLLKDKQ